MPVPGTMVRISCALVVAAGIAVSPAPALEFGFGGETEPVAGAPSIDLGGSAEFRLRGYPFLPYPGAPTVEARPAGRLDFSWSSPSAEAKIAVELDPGALAPDPGSLVDEAWLAAYFRAFELRGGLMRTVWGKGDGLHVLDVVDPVDYSDFVNADPRSSKIAQPAVRLDARFSDTGKLELLYVPLFSPHRTPTAGRWKPVEYTILSTILASPPYGSTEPLSDILVHPDADTLGRGQFGLRLTGTAGGIDLGAQYYRGFIREPSINLNPADFAANSGRIAVAYDPFHQIGIDSAFAVAGFAVRAEAALTLTPDVAGSDWLVRNRTFGWVLGADRDILGFGVNLQMMGTHLLDRAGITLPYDVDARTSPFTGVLALRLARSFSNERIVLETTGVWIAGTGEYMLRPRATFALPGEVSLVLAGAWFGGEFTGRFGQYRGNPYLEATLSVPF